MTGGDLVQLAVTGALPNTTSWLVMGITQLGAPFKGGTLVPNPDWIFAGFPINGLGQFNALFLWPVGIPGGIDSFYQFWITDGGVSNNLSATNGLRATTP